jgi:hypothetical protein
MKAFPKYLILPLITAGIVTIGIIIFYYLDAPRDRNVAAPPSGKDTFRKPAAAPVALPTEQEATYSPQIATSDKDFVYPVDNTRDPFQQVSVPVKPIHGVRRPSIILTGVIWDGQNPIAIISDSENNSYLVRTGEEISYGGGSPRIAPSGRALSSSSSPPFAQALSKSLKAKVLDIRPRSITIERDGKTQELALWPAK